MMRERLHGWRIVCSRYAVSIVRRAGLSLSVQEMRGEILSIPQPLTILRRPAVGRPQLVSHDADDEHANLIWIRFNEALRSGDVPVREGRFGARMRVGSVADGPFQFTLQE